MCVCVWPELSGLSFTSCSVPHHQWFEGGGGFPEWLIMQESRGVGGAYLWIWQEYV